MIYGGGAMAELQINSEVISGVPTIYLKGELDSYSAPRVRQLLESMTDLETPKVLIDISSLEYIDSAGLGVLVAALKKAADHSGTIALIGPAPNVARVLTVTGLDKLFTVYDNALEAQDQLRNVL
jgi:anti-sigma B factor antagonist